MPRARAAGSPSSLAGRKAAISPSVGTGTPDCKLISLFLVHLFDDLEGPVAPAIEQGAFLEDEIVLLGLGHVLDDLPDFIQDGLGHLLLITGQLLLNLLDLGLQLL